MSVNHCCNSYEKTNIWNQQIMNIGVSHCEIPSETLWRLLGIPCQEGLIETGANETMIRLMETILPEGPAPA